MIHFLFFLFAFSAYSSVRPIDERLNSYIEEFNLTPVRSPGQRNQKLFILGRNLFHEKALSGNNNIRCEDCHHPRVMTQEGIPLSVGEGSTGIQFGTTTRQQGSARVLARNTPALFNLHNVDVMFWDGRVEHNPETGEFKLPLFLRADIAATLKSALAAQAIFPIVDHDEMRGLKGSNPIADANDEHEAWDLIVERILNIPGYDESFTELYPGEKINIGHIGEALAEFQGQNFFFADTPFDRYIQGNKEALSLKQKQGMDIFFNKGKCGDCHNGEHLSALDYDGVGAPQIGPGKQEGDDYGRYQWDGDEGSKYAFRVPPLRNAGLTAPYFHNGSMKSLEAVVDHYNDIKLSLESYRIIEVFANYLKPLNDHDHSTNEVRYFNLPEDLPLKLHLSNDEKDSLVDFLRSGLTDMRLQSFINGGPTLAQ